MPPRQINESVHGKRCISADTALGLARYFGTSERFWMNLQGRYDLEVERDRLTSVIDEIHQRSLAARRAVNRARDCFWDAWRCRREQAAHCAKWFR